VYSTGYLTMQNGASEPKVERRFYFFLLLFIGSMAGLVFIHLLGLLVFFELTGVCSVGPDRILLTTRSVQAALKAIITRRLRPLVFMPPPFFFALRAVRLSATWRR
jgi:hydrogenase-4 component D